MHRGAGAYICGEETGLIESLEGKRPNPRIKPLIFQQCWDSTNAQPLLIMRNLCNVKHIMEMGGETFSKIGKPNNTGTRICVYPDRSRIPVISNLNAVR